MSGFKSAAHFSRMFKDAYGCTPREFRAAHHS
jgi:AraC-like DNA-binding protein